MKNKSVNKILYGNWRPWIPGGSERLIEEYAMSNPGDTVALFTKVQFPEPFDRVSLAYSDCIQRNLSRWHSLKVRDIEKQQAVKDRRYLVNVATGDMETTLKEIPALREEVLDHPENEQELSLFVLDTLSMGLINLLLDFSKRYSNLDQVRTYNLQEAYLKLLNMSPPSPSPYKPTVFWYRQATKERLQIVISGDLSLLNIKDSGVTEFIDELYRRLEEERTSGSDYRVYADLIQHLENALFLIKMEASFLEKDPDELLDSDTCREWVQGMKNEVIFQGKPDDLLEILVQLDEVRSWFRKNVWLADKNPEYGVGSEAGQWLREVDRLHLTARNELPQTRDRQQEYTADTADTMDFTAFFKSRFVHKSDVKQAFGVDKKTLKGYLEDTGDTQLRVLRLKQNRWYYRSDLEAFLKEHTSYE